MTIEQENKEIAEFIKNNPFPESATSDEFLMALLNVAREMSKRCGGIAPLGSSYDYRYVKKIYENILDEDIVKECGRELNSKDGMRDMARCWMVLDELIRNKYNNNDENNNYDRMVILSLGRMVEHYWDGIGEWYA